MRYRFLFILLFSISVSAQQSTIREVIRPITTYPYSDPDPVARPGRVYPYFRYDGFTNNSIVENWKMVELENDFIRLAITPEIGGKVWEAYEKSQQYPFVFTTSTIKFRDISLRGPWTTGGLEFNFGDIGHATTCFAPVDYFIRNNPDGSVSCFIGATEWASRTTWRVEIKLEPDKAFFTTRSWWYNNTPVEQEYYHWINAGFKAEGDLEFVFPGTHHIGHGGENDTWPLDSMGREISFYEKNNFGSYKSYHILGRTSGFYGGFWHNDNMGFGHIAPYHEKLGKKVWVLGLSQEGERWENLLGNNDGLNVELQSGRLFNQASQGSMFTPFKHVGFAPYVVDTWTDHWFPVRHTRGLTNASPRGALNLRIENNWLKIDWMSLENQHETMQVISSGKPLMHKVLDLKPLGLYRDSIKWEGNIDEIIVKLGNDVITEEYKKPISRPLKSPPDFDWDSEYGLFLRGSDLSKQKNYIEAEVYLMKALGKNPDMVPALTQMAQLRFRQGQYEKAREFAGKALAVNTYDPEANFLWGLSSEKLGNETDAMDGYSVAAQSPQMRQAAWLRISGMAVYRRNWKEADNMINRCLGGYPPNELAGNIKALISRKKGDSESALTLLE
jgi:tetratricopeptide (TPR) repeat protein